MEFIKRSSTVWGEVPLTQDEALPWMERCGRSCYNSLDRMKSGSDRPFVNKLFRDGHMSVLEHSNLVLRSPIVTNPNTERMVQESIFISPFIYTHIENGRVYIYGNWRAFWEFFNHPETGDESLCSDFFKLPWCASFGEYETVLDPEEVPIACKAVTVEFITDRAITHEIVRHRPVAYSQESQRYCNYDDGVTFVVPVHFESEFDKMLVHSKDEIKLTGAWGVWAEAMQSAEDSYLRLRGLKLSSQKARLVLTNSTAAKLVATAYLPEWWHIFKLRIPKTADPGMTASMTPVRDVFGDRGWLNG